jgi:tRNA pseudouridine55 synthase
MKRTKYDNINGWLVIDKPAGLGSTDVVNRTRRLLNANKNGHAGTLDPFASGVLPIAFGEATKLIPFVTDGDKTYEFSLCFGAATTTDDPEGEVCAVSPLIPTAEDIARILPTFLGRIEQIPPIYSALKINGERAYDLARRGENVDMKPRFVFIKDIKMLEQLSENTFKFCVSCSKGTYVRTLGRDIALKLGTLGHLTALRRTKCAIFSLDDTILLENLENMLYLGDRQESLLPIETSLRDIAVIAVSEAEAVKLSRGQGLSPQAYRKVLAEGETAAAMYRDCLIALVRMSERKIAPIRVFNL